MYRFSTASVPPQCTASVPLRSVEAFTPVFHRLYLTTSNNKILFIAIIFLIKAALFLDYMEKTPKQTAGLVVSRERTGTFFSTLTTKLQIHFGVLSINVI